MAETLRSDGCLGDKDVTVQIIEAATRVAAQPFEPGRSGNLMAITPPAGGGSLLPSARACSCSLPAAASATALRRRRPDYASTHP